MRGRRVCAAFHADREEDANPNQNELPLIALGATIRHHLSAISVSSATGVKVRGVEVSELDRELHVDFEG